MRLLYTVKVPEYIRKAILSNSRRAIYYIKGENEPTFKKYKDTKKYHWVEFKVTRNGKRVSREFLVEKATGKKVIKNNRTVGTPKLKSINGQDIYSGNTREHTRGKIMDQVKDDMRPFIREMPPIISFPICIRLILKDAFHDPDITVDRWDVGNRMWPYCKAFEDVLQEEGKIPDDDRLFITAPPAPIYTPVDTPEERCLEFRIYRDEREEIKNSKYYKRWF